MHTPIESSVLPGFYKIPGLDHHVVNEKGQIANEHTGHILALHTNGAGYLWCSMRCDNLSTIRIHRAVALAFLDYPDDYQNYVVNHKDGNKLNNAISNLEWCTHKYNCEHAGMLGLTPKCSPIQVRDNKYGVVEEFPSIAACAEYYQREYSEIMGKIRYGMKGARIWPDGKQYRRRSTEPWPKGIPDKDVERKQFESFILRKDSGTFGRAVELDMRDLKTGEITHFDRISDAAKFFNMSLTGVWTWLCKNDQPVVFGRYHLKLKIDPMWKTPGDLILEDAKIRGYIPIQAHNPVTGEIRVFNSLKVCGEKMGVRLGTLFERLKSDKDHVSPDGWCYNRYPVFEESVPFEKMET